MLLTEIYEAVDDDPDNDVAQMLSSDLLQENLRNKLEQLTSMYEEVDSRLASLEKAYAKAESEVRTEKTSRNGRFADCARCVFRSVGAT